MRTALLLALLTVPVAASAQIQPGQWDMVTTMSDFAMPGAPPGIAALMKGRPIRISQCITAEQAARGPQELLKTDSGCRFTRYSMTGGVLDAAMVCQKGGQTMSTTSRGSFTPTGFTTTGRTVMSGAQAMSMTATTAGRRIGACTSKPAGAARP